MPIDRAAAHTLHLPPHLREVCAILARGIVRLRSRSIAAIDAGARECGESSLVAREQCHFSAVLAVLRGLEASAG